MPAAHQGELAEALHFALPGVRMACAEMDDQTRELDPVHTGVRRAALHMPGT